MEYRGPGRTHSGVDGLSQLADQGLGGGPIMLRQGLYHLSGFTQLGVEPVCDRTKGHIVPPRGGPEAPVLPGEAR